MRRWFWLALAIGAVLAAGSVLLVSTDSAIESAGGGESSNGTEKPGGGTPTSSPVMSPDDPSAAEASAAALAAIDGYLTVSAQLLENPSQDLTELSVYAAGEAYGSIEAQVLEFLDYQARVEGQAEIVSSAVEEVGLSAGDRTVVVGVCLDNSRVTVFTPENPEGVQGGERTAQILTVQQIDGTWKVVGTSFPDDPSC